MTTPPTGLTASGDVESTVLVAKVQVDGDSDAGQSKAPDD